LNIGIRIRKDAVGVSSSRFLVRKWEAGQFEFDLNHFVGCLRVFSALSSSVTKTHPTPFDGLGPSVIDISFGSSCYKHFP
jgi:hypothetical protein